MTHIVQIYHNNAYFGHTQVGRDPIVEKQWSTSGVAYRFCSRAKLINEEVLRDLIKTDYTYFSLFSHLNPYVFIQNRV
jgi:hypothetical protein